MTALPKISIGEYHRLGEYNENGRRTELIRVIIIEKVSKSPHHSTLGSIMFQLISAQLPTGYITRKDHPLTFADSEPEPDVAVCKGGENDFREAHPTTAELVVEVAVRSVAPLSAAVFDRSVSEWLSCLA